MGIIFGFAAADFVLLAVWVSSVNRLGEECQCFSSVSFVIFDPFFCLLSPTVELPAPPASLHFEFE